MSYRWFKDWIPITEPRITQQERREIASQTAAAASVTRRILHSDAVFRSDNVGDGQDYVVWNGKTHVLRPRSWLSRMTPSQFKMALTTPPRPYRSRDPYNLLWVYVNIIFHSIDRDWQLPQIFLEDCIMLACDETDIGKLGRHVRLGLPRRFTEIITASLLIDYPDFLKWVEIRDGRIWVDAAWGIEDRPCQFRDGQGPPMTDLRQVMRSRRGEQVRGRMLLAFAAKCRAEQQNMGAGTTSSLYKSTRSSLRLASAPPARSTSRVSL